MDRRLRQINDAIVHEPDLAMHYVLRAEYWLKHGEPASAIEDYEHALTLAYRELVASEWAYREQSMIDRIEAGLRRARDY